MNTSGAGSPQARALTAASPHPRPTTSRPISLGGLDTADNLVPACETCNNDKRAKLLTEWCIDRVTYAATHSPKIAAELERLRQQTAAPTHPLTEGYEHE